MRKAGIYWLALGAFLVGTSELVIAGILDQIATDMHISIASAGQLVTVYSLVFAIGSPILIMLTSRMERKKLLLLSLIVFIAGCLLALVGSNYNVFIISRIVLAISAGIYTVVSLHVGTTLVPKEKQGSAVGIILLGTSGSMVLGIPLGTLAGHYLGWRYIFLALAVLALLTKLALWLSIGRSTAAKHDQLSGNGKSLLLNIGTFISLLVSLFWITGYSIVYTYISPFLQFKTGTGEQGISSFLFLFGLFGLLGTYAGGAAADRWGVFRSLALSLICHAMALLLLFISGPSIVLTAVLLAIWAGSAWMSLPILQAYFASKDTRSSGLLMSLNSSVIHLGIAVGAGGGGLIIHNLELSNLSWIGASIVAAALLPLVLVIRQHQSASSSVTEMEKHKGRGKIEKF